MTENRDIELQQFLRLLDGYVAGELDPPDLARFNDLLRCDPRCLRLLHATGLIATTLHDLQPQHTPELNAVSPDLGDQARGSLSPCRETPTQTAQNPSRIRNRPYALLRHWQLWAAAAAIVLAIPLVSHFSYIFKFDFNWGSPDTSEDLFRGRVAILFEISDGAEFTYDGPGRYDPQLTQGEDIYPGVIDLKYGTLNISFDSKAEVTLKAPAKFYLNHPKRARLEHGELTAYCPPEARGFTIGAPGCAVIDLGTRFWMKVDKLGFTDVTVREGKVNLKRDNGELVSLLRGAKARAPHALTRKLSIVDQPSAHRLVTAVPQPVEIIGDAIYLSSAELSAEIPLRRNTIQIILERSNWPVPSDMLDRIIAIEPNRRMNGDALTTLTSTDAPASIAPGQRVHAYIVRVALAGRAKTHCRATVRMPGRIVGVIAEPEAVTAALQAMHGAPTSLHESLREGLDTADTVTLGPDGRTLDVAWRGRSTGSDNLIVFVDSIRVERTDGAPLVVGPAPQPQDSPEPLSPVSEPADR